MSRAFWKGVISFGMVVIPVKMSVATRDKTPDFHYLHNKCLTRPRQVLYCAEDDEYFSTKEAVRGYEYGKNRYVVFTKDDFKKVPLRTAHSIDIIAFVDIKEVDVVYYSGSHYLEPEELGIKPFFLLKTVMQKTNLVAIAKVAFQRREHLCCLRPTDQGMVLHTLHYKQDILPAAEPSVPEQGLTDAEVEMASRLVEAMTTGFRPDEYHDEYASALQSMVEAKLEGEEVKPPEIPKVEMEDLMMALKASVAEAGRR